MGRDGGDRGRSAATTAPGAAPQLPIQHCRACSGVWAAGWRCASRNQGPVCQLTHLQTKLADGDSWGILSTSSGCHREQHHSSRHRRDHRQMTSTTSTPRPCVTLGGWGWWGGIGGGAGLLLHASVLTSGELWGWRHASFQDEARTQKSKKNIPTRQALWCWGDQAPPPPHTPQPPPLQTCVGR